MSDLVKLPEASNGYMATFRKRACAKYAYDRLPCFMVGVLAQDRPLRPVR